MISAFLERFQPLGRALMLPIAVLPIAALLLRLGQPDMLDIHFVAAAGDAIFNNLGLLFAIGVAVGLARENHGAAGLAGVVCFLVATEGAKALLAIPPDQLVGADEAARNLAGAAWKAKEISKLSVPAGILSGVAAGYLYNRYATIKLPGYLGFFAGRRFVPIVAGLIGVVFAATLGTGFPWFEAGVDALSRWVVAAGPLGLFVYGFLNRMLLVTGLHHILNNVAWFLLGDFNGVTGDLKRFFAGDPAAGNFMAGFFPVMMFGLPSACFAMYRAAAPDRRKAVSGLYLGLALTSFLTGVTEPIEFTFLFLAPMLFLVHAVLTGLAMMIMSLLDIKLGFGFSAGLFDYALNFGLATRPLLLLPVGLAYAFIYYAAFIWCIRRFDLKTPGREPATMAAASDVSHGSRAIAFVEALGGPANIVSIDACMTRLRLALVQPSVLDRPALAALGARGVLEIGASGVQVILGPEADQVAGEIRTALADGAVPPANDLHFDDLANALMAVGTTKIESAGRRLLVTSRPSSAQDEQRLLKAGIKAVAHTPLGLHLIIGDGNSRNLAARLSGKLELAEA